MNKFKRVTRENGDDEWKTPPVSEYPKKTATTTRILHAISQAAFANNAAQCFSDMMASSSIIGKEHRASTKTPLP